MPDVRWYAAGASTFSAGTAGTPGIRFTDDADTGFFNRASNELNLSLGGTEEYRWSTATAYFSGNDIYLGDTLGATDGPLIRPAASPGIFFGGTEEYRIGSATFYLGSNDLNFGSVGNTGAATFRATGNNLRLTNLALGIGIRDPAANTLTMNSSGHVGAIELGSTTFNTRWTHDASTAPYNLFNSNFAGDELALFDFQANGTSRLLITGTNGVVVGQGLMIGVTASAARIASTYLMMQGVSGAGGTPTSTNLTAGDADIAVYAQQAHDSAATKFVIAYNSYNGLNYLSIPMDGTSTAWTHNQTRP